MRRKKTPPHGFDLDRAQAAEYVGESVHTLHMWAYHKPAKNLPYIVAGGKAWYRRADLDAFLNGKVVHCDTASAEVSSVETH